MPEYRITFGQQYPREPHPRLPDIAHHDGWLTIIANDEDAARELAFQIAGEHWSMIYRPTPADDFWGIFPLGELLRIIDPRMTSAAYLLQTEAVNGDQFLVHVWADGTGELAARVDHTRWGSPLPLTPAP